MYHVARQFLLWELTASGVLALVLGIVIVLQGLYRRLVSLCRRGLRSEALATASVVRLRSPRIPEAAASRP
jgi:hypothetical protein